MVIFLRIALELFSVPSVVAARLAFFFARECTLSIAEERPLWRSITQLIDANRFAKPPYSTEKKTPTYVGPVGHIQKVVNRDDMLIEIRYGTRVSNAQSSLFLCDSGDDQWPRFYFHV